MDRVSTNLPNDNMQYFTRQRSVDMNEVQSRIASQSRILNLRDDPASASHATRYQSFLTRLERYSDNIRNAGEQLQITESHLQQALAIVQESRQLAVQGANGTYTKDDLRAMASQIDEYLAQLVQVSNSVSGDGTSVFAGTRTKNVPFRVVEGTAPGSDRTLVVGVEYLGNIGQKPMEIADNQFVETGMPGNAAFWAENQAVFARRDATDFVVTADSTIAIDGVSIDLKQGDNVFSVVSKINESKAAVKARLDPVENSIVIETTNPHQLWVQDLSGRVMQDLGMIVDGSSPPPANFSKDVVKSGGSLFDALISLRDNLNKGDNEQIGGDNLRALDSAMSNLLSNLGAVGARSSRLELAYKSTEKLMPDYQARLSRELDIDITKAITDYKVLELTHEAALSTAAKVLRPTLLDFLR